MPHLGIAFYLCLSTAFLKHDSMQLNKDNKQQCLSRALPSPSSSEITTSGHLRGSGLHLLVSSAALGQSQHSAPCWWRSRRTRGGSSRRCTGGHRLPCQGCRGPGVSWPAEHAGQSPALGTGRGHSGRAGGAGNSSAPGDIPPHRPAWCLQGGSPSAPSPVCPTALLCLRYLQEQHHRTASGLGAGFKRNKSVINRQSWSKWGSEEQTPQLVSSQCFCWKRRKSTSALCSTKSTKFMPHLTPCST